MDILISSLIYITVLAYIVTYNLTHKPDGDQTREWRACKGDFPLMGDHGYLLYSCVLMFGLPLLLKKHPGISYLSYRIIPAVFFALMPSFSFLLFREFLPLPQSLISTFLILSSFYILYYPDNGRVGMANGILTVIVWSLFTGHLTVMLIFSILLILSHYGTSCHFTVIAVLSTATAVFFTEWTHLAVLSVFLIVLIYLWFYKLKPSTGTVISTFAAGTVSVNSNTLKTQVSTARYYKIVEDKSPLRNFFRIWYRESVVQAAFGVTLKTASFLQRTEFVLSWTIVLTVSIGLVLMPVPVLYKILASVSYLLILWTLLIPHMSVWYGISRVWFVSLIFLAPFINIIPPYLSLPLIALFSFCIIYKRGVP